MTFTDEPKIWGNKHKDITRHSNMGQHNKDTFVQESIAQLKKQEK